MKLCTIRQNDSEQAAVLIDEELVTIRAINEALQQSFHEDLLLLLRSGQLVALEQLIGEQSLQHVPCLRAEAIQFCTLYINAEHIFGVGLNYHEKLVDLQTERADEPVVFMKPNSTIAQNGEVLQLPTAPQSVSAEGELALIIGKRCRHVSEDEALSYVAAYTISLDLTAKDIHAKNPRFVQISKVFPTFFSFGPVLVTADELGDLQRVVVQSVHNGEVIHENTIDHMLYSPAYIVSYISQFVELQPGDIIMTGTPGSFLIEAGDVAACRITNMPVLQHHVM